MQRGGDPIAFYAALSAAISEQLRHEMGKPMEGLTREQLRQAMSDAGFAPQLIDDVATALDGCDAARFAPGAMQQAELDRTLTNTHQLVRRIAAGPTRSRSGARRRAA